MTYSRSAALTVILFLLTSCLLDTDDVPVPADASADSELDSGALDSGTIDSGTIDSGTIDSGTADAGMDSQPELTDANVDSSDAPDADAPDAGCSTQIRGIWMYRHPGNPLGTDVIVGSASEEAVAIANLVADDVDRVYGNYGDRPTDGTSDVADWNVLLDEVSIESHLLLGDGVDVFPGCREGLLEQVQTRFIDFNDTFTAAGQQFTALHLDIEPQQYKASASFPSTTSCGLRVPNWPFWNDATMQQKTARYDALEQTFQAVRDLLDSSGYAATPIYVDLAPWVNAVPSGNFDWTTSPYADGDAWLAQVASVVDGITFMTYERDTAAEIDGAMVGEYGLATEVRVSVNAKETAANPGSPLTWTGGLPQMWSVVNDLEAAHCGDPAVDLFNYRYLNE